MRQLSTILLAAALSLTSCAWEQKPVVRPAPDVEIGPGGEVMPNLEPPKLLVEDWGQGLLGEWETAAESDLGPFKSWVKGTGRMRVEQGIGGQFLIVKRTGRVVELSEEYVQHLRQNRHASEKDIESLRTMPFEELEISTVDPRTGEVIGYLFDSWRCVAKGTGRRAGNKETMRWAWSVGGRGTSVRVTERVSDDRLVVTHTYALPEGATMEDRVQMTRSR
jgi:hypothetical protein